jgi:hypothetical protein
MQRADVRFVTAQKASYAADLGVSRIPGMKPDLANGG